jgi:heme O synthase-like polyprenyltransferase
MMRKIIGLTITFLPAILILIAIGFIVDWFVVIVAVIGAAVFIGCAYLGVMIEDGKGPFFKKEK